MGAMASKNASSASPGELLDGGGERRRGERAGGDDHAVPVGWGQAGDLGAVDLNERVSGDAPGDFRREQVAAVYSCPLLRETPVEHVGNARQFMELCETSKIDFIVFYTGVGVEFLVCSKACVLPCAARAWEPLQFSRAAQLPASPLVQSASAALRPSEP